MRLCQLFSLGLLASGCGPTYLDPDSEDGGLSGPGQLRLNGPKSVPGAMDWANDPSAFDPSYEYLFDALPQSGALDVEPWSGSYWPEYKGGIAYRWATHSAFNYEMLSDEDVKNPELVRILSPAEKYDLFVGNTDWSLTYSALSASSPREPKWTGYCHGWSPASAAYDEPYPVTVVNPDGIEVPFSASDIKALLTFFRAEVVTSSYGSHTWAVQPLVVGSTCFSSDVRDPACTDTNPAAFHIVLANQIGVLRESFNVDVEVAYERWNQPVFGYETRLLQRRAPSAGAAETAVEEVLVETRMDYTMEIEPTWDPVVGTSGQNTRSAVYVYSLELDSKGAIVGGQWYTRFEDGSVASFNDVWGWLAEVDDNKDGKPDYDVDEISSIMFDLFEYPDYLWIQPTPEWPSTFVPAYSSYSLVNVSGTGAQTLYDYFGRLPDLLDASYRAAP